MSVVRIAFLGTPEFARFHLAALLNDSHFEVVGVVSQPDRPSGRNMKLTPSPVKQLAMDSGLKVITPESIKVESVLKEIGTWKAEAAVVVAYGQIVSQKFLDMFPEKVVNIHGSLLPRWRGAAPIQRAIEAGDKITGVSLQVMTRKMDAGAVIGSYSLPIGENMNAQELHDELMPLGAQLLSVEFMDYLRGNLTAHPQDESLVTFAHKIDKSEATIDWRRPAQEIHNQVRAFYMGPGSVCSLNKKKLKLVKTEFVAGDEKANAGTVTKVNREDFIVACGRDALRILEVQPESRPRMKVKDFLLGHSLTEGTNLI